MKCWICDGYATSGEHRIKKSDLKLLYPIVNKENPIFHRRNGDVKNPIISVKSARFTFNGLICEKCNNETTQDYDTTWEKLSHYLHQNWSTIKTSGEFDLSNVFPDDFKSNMILVHLYFVKIFGCKTKEASAPIDLRIFSESIVNKKENPYLYISLRDSENKYKGNYSSISDIEIYKNDDSIIYAHLFYTIGNITVDMIFSREESSINFNGALIPSAMNKVIQLSKLNYSQEYSRLSC